MGLVLPATAEHKGYIAEKKKGHIKILAPGEKIEFNIEAGLLTPEDTGEVESKINSIGANNYRMNEAQAAVRIAQLLYRNLE